jgi:glycosyltransferase involved in cell wall biosynthesis
MAWVGSYLTAIFSHRVILVSENDLTQTKMPWITSKCTVIHTAIQTFPVVTREEARAALLPKEIIDARCQDIWLVTHGEINRNKNHVTAIDAVAEFNSTHSTKIFYNIIGEGDLIGTLKEQVDLKGLNEYVHFTGYLAEARQYLLAFDIYLISSKKEGLPYSLLEAGLSGLPCIASNVGGIPEVIVDKSTGLLINPDNHMSIVAALDFLFTNTDKRSAYSKNLSEHIDKNFSLGEMIEKTKAVYAL